MFALVSWARRCVEETDPLVVVESVFWNKKADAAALARHYQEYLTPAQKRRVEQSRREEEERRLFYVAVTRAKTELYLSYPLLRFMHGSGGETMQQPSRFLDEIDGDLVEEWNLQSFDPYG